MSDKIQAVIIGHAVADAIGVPFEFCTREELKHNPVTKMVGYGTYPVPAGAWSDDTSMSIASLDSLANGYIDIEEIMENFSRWYTNGKYTPTGTAFDIGTTCLMAIKKHIHNKNISAAECGLTNEYSNGNGSLMRIHPFALYAYYKKMTRNEWEELIEKGSSLTHAHMRSKLACKIYTLVLFHLLDNPCSDSISTALNAAKSYYCVSDEYIHFASLFDSDLSKTDEKEILSTGYVVDTLKAALWCLLTTDSYTQCVLKAVNLGFDTDTVAAVSGGLAGALYGYMSIPDEWKTTLIQREYIEEMCQRAEQNWL